MREKFVFTLIVSSSCIKFSIYIISIYFLILYWNDISHRQTIECLSDISSVIFLILISLISVDFFLLWRVRISQLTAGDVNFILFGFSSQHRDQGARLKEDESGWIKMSSFFRGWIVRILHLKLFSIGTRKRAKLLLFYRIYYAHLSQLYTSYKHSSIFHSVIIIRSVFFHFLGFFFRK